MGLNVNNVPFAEDGFLAINATGSTSKGSVIIGLTDCSLSYSNDQIELQHFESNFNKYFVSTSSNWTMSGSFNIVGETGSTAIDTARYSGDTKLLSGVQRTKNGLDLLEMAKSKNLKVGVIRRLKAGNYQSGEAIITSVNIDSSVGAVTTGSIELQGVGPLTKSTS